ncbi:Nucleotidyltransferase substrate binding protein HI0074 [Thermodesulfatator indicus DSM 15286]|uniref:Nucleotidyltransferase substrate binding protein HI0074 n=1 Tax=Thermodesulfatator indicus (strain DSM 15286 / JCM 11887 / CIR29812) TaxID=667014 RepID=F8ADS0_THEID|nr:nucleotidyltransferase substrate binding protein [Thermodesulfatator indicus]AEH46028.1 Nucleotidyltransferase substrate binding protein HI0074 [Thermodesulfatator indicus DSM 15286]
MDLKIRLNTAYKALETLSELLDKKVELTSEFYVIFRDASIQRFEYTFEVVWKVLKQFLWEIEKLECYSPKSCFRTAGQVGLLSPEETELAFKNGRCQECHLAHLQGGSGQADLP